MSKKEDILKIRNYFGKHDKTAFEHWAYAFLDELWNEYSFWENTSEQNDSEDKIETFKPLVKPDTTDRGFIFILSQIEKIKEMVDEEIQALTRKPTHGICCTCQECGQLFDDCNCIEISILKNLKGRLREGNAIPAPNFEDEVLPSVHPLLTIHLGYCLNCDCNLGFVKDEYFPFCSEWCKNYKSII